VAALLMHFNYSYGEKVALKQGTVRFFAILTKTFTPALVFSLL
jgi:hypothetical protein